MENGSRRPGSSHLLYLCLLLSLLCSGAGCTQDNGAQPALVSEPPADPHPALGAYLGGREAFDYVERDFDVARVVLYPYADGLEMVLEVIDGPVSVNTKEIYLSQSGRDWSLGGEGAIVRLTRGWSRDEQELGRGSYRALIEYGSLSTTPFPFDPSQPFRLLWGPYEVWF